MCALEGVGDLLLYDVESSLVIGRLECASVKQRIPCTAFAFLQREPHAQAASLHIQGNRLVVIGTNQVTLCSYTTFGHCTVEDVHVYACVRMCMLFSRIEIECASVVV